MYRFLLLLCCWLLPAAVLADAPEQITLHQALKEGKVKLYAKASGESYKANGLSITLENTQTKPLKIVVTPGLIFEPAESQYQPLLLAANTVVYLGAGGKNNFTGQTYCAFSSAHMPRKDVVYTFEKRADTNLRQVLAFVAKNRVDASLAQKAVWVLTNQHSVSNVYEEGNTRTSDSLVALLCRLTGQPKPQYYVERQLNDAPGQPVYENKILKMHTLFDWEYDQPATYTLAIYDSTGAVVQPILKDKQLQKGNHRITVTFEAQRVNAGNYFIRLHRGTALLREQKVTVD